MSTPVNRAPADRPYRGSAEGRPDAVPLPPKYLWIFRKWQLRKSWHYVGFWSEDLLLCAARVKVGFIKQQYWAVWDRKHGLFRSNFHFLRRRVHLSPDRAQVADVSKEQGDRVTVDVSLEPIDEFEVYRPERRAYIWSHKQLCRKATATVTIGTDRRTAEGTAFVDVNAGYHFRHTRWQWSAGTGIDQHGRHVAWNAIVGLFDTLKDSERTVWVEGKGTEIEPVCFPHLDVVTFHDGSRLTFTREKDLRKRVGIFVLKSNYDHAFGTYSGTLPGGIEVKEAVGVRERQNALW